MSPLEKIIAWYSTLSPASLPEIHALYAALATFKDPFNQVSGVAAIQQIFLHMFATTENPRFIVVDAFEQGQQAFLSWQFVFGLNGKNYTVNGGTHLRLNQLGQIIEHRDYWDPAEELWQKLPLIGAPVRWLRKKFSAT
ncbi:MAG: nuclear transport factor 2 family protein [Burkholderiales bacterium]|nr:nuclear transport factor 2 family protein [Burkholderiales bacterium]